ncbi:hypothetical protein BS17DRAFT_699224 [Gyrodon lividus]|nr:hypothetical protein BS17DRAFT_699224 [Gyrodon lividus]
MSLALISPRKEEVEDTMHVHISSLSVLPAHRGQGVARQLMTQSQSCMRTGLRAQLPMTDNNATLHVRKSNASAIALYTLLEVVVKPGHYKSLVIR